MRLTNNDLDMFNGEYGKAVQFAMKLIVKIGKIYQADDLIDVSSAHILGHYGSLHDAGVEFYEKLANLEAKCKIPTTVDPSSLPENWEEINIPNNYAEKQLRLYRAIQKIGVIQNWSCTPYEFANIPRYGEYIAWAESSAVVYANSVLGARTNRTPAGLDIAAAITGRMPRIGFYLDKNRKGQILVKIKKKKLEDLDYHSIGYIIGKRVKTKVPVIEGIPKNCASYQLKYLGSAAASSGAVSLFHAIGVTPEAIKEDPFKEKNPKEVIEINPSDIENTKQKISTNENEGVDLVTIGCPHLSLEELRKVAKILKGKKIRSDTMFWIYLSRAVYTIAQQMDLITDIKDSGAQILLDTCPVISPLKYCRLKSMMTNSAKNANVVPTEHDMEVIYRDLETCVKVAIK